MKTLTISKFIDLDAAHASAFLFETKSFLPGFVSHEFFEVNLYKRLASTMDEHRIIHLAISHRAGIAKGFIDAASLRKICGVIEAHIKPFLIALERTVFARRTWDRMRNTFRQILFTLIPCDLAVHQWEARFDEGSGINNCLASPFHHGPIRKRVSENPMVKSWPTHALHNSSLAPSLIVGDTKILNQVDIARDRLPWLKAENVAAYALADNFRFVFLGALPPSPPYFPIRMERKGRDRGKPCTILTDHSFDQIDRELSLCRGKNWYFSSTLKPLQVLIRGVQFILSVGENCHSRGRVQFSVASHLVKHSALYADSEIKNALFAHASPSFAFWLSSLM